MADEMSWADRLSKDRRLKEEEAKRYATKPLLILLENYVLDCIGEMRVHASEMSRAVKRAFRLDAVTDWKAAMRAGLQLDDGLDDEVKRVWEANKARFQAAGEIAVPLEFARVFVDANFASLID
jgi:hypothetical protein